MKIYFAGYTSLPAIIEFVPTVLGSYLAFKGNPQKLLDQIIKLKIQDFFLDSGAFSAFTQGEKIDIDEYIQFCHVVKDKVKVMANLDVISDFDTTYKNWLHMKSKGINALPVIHFGAPEKYFDLYLKEHKVPYLALGGLVPYARQKERLKEWLDHCFFMIKDHFPMKIHLFGVISAWALRRYPAYSCDGTSWLQGGKFGSTIEFNKLNIRRKAYNDFYLHAKDYKYRDIVNARAYMLLQSEITKLWKSRGIDWKD
ncbi:MAG: hypothetical protein KKC55_17400 [Gammaproteobacteria bacterium]|nr:hypothetical protein [Gammaproteobacteria bacterium]